MPVAVNSAAAAGSSGLLSTMVGNDSDTGVSNPVATSSASCVESISSDVDLEAGGSRSADINSEFVHLGPRFPGRGRALLPHPTSTLYFRRGFIGRGTRGVQRGRGGRPGGSHGKGGGRGRGRDRGRGRSTPYDYPSSVVSWLNIHWCRSYGAYRQGHSKYLLADRLLSMCSSLIHRPPSRRVKGLVNLG